MEECNSWMDRFALWSIDYKYIQASLESCEMSYIEDRIKIPKCASIHIRVKIWQERENLQKPFFERFAELGFRRPSAAKNLAGSSGDDHSHLPKYFSHLLNQYNYLQMNSEKNVTQMTSCKVPNSLLLIQKIKKMWPTDAGSQMTF